MIVLGIHNTGINSSACLIIDGKIKHAMLEERITRKKHDKSFPHKTILKILELSNLIIDDIDYFAIGWNPAINIADKFRAGFSEWASYAGYRFSTNPNNILPLLQDRNFLNTDQIFFKKNNETVNIKYISHHIAHAANAYYSSNFEEALILTCDGYGEKATTAWYEGSGKNINQIGEILFPHSIGMLFSTITEYLGFRANLDEWKVMGASAYGNKDAYIDDMWKLIKCKGLQFELNLEYFDFYNFDNLNMFSKKLINLLGPIRLHKDKMEKRHYDIAASLQAITEELFITMLTQLKMETKLNNICLSGGSVMNSVVNGLLYEKKIFENMFVPFAPDDSGNSIGAAIYVSSLIEPKIDRKALQNPYLGSEYSDEEIYKEFKLVKLRPEKLNKENLTEKIVELLISGQIIGWFQGRMEFGQRALGNRSIIADPRNSKMKNAINSAVKFREDFRPFAPSVLESEVNNWFDLQNISSPYMEKVFKIKKELSHLVPAVVHYDMSCRIQTVNEHMSPLYYSLIKNFYKVTKVPMILNTSFNINNEPIVLNPSDAIRTFFSSGLDVLIIGPYILKKD